MGCMKTDILKWEDYKRTVPDWFRDAKFGLFFHWGPYSVPEHGSEWYSRNMYETGHEQNLFHERTFGKVSKFGYKDFLPMFQGEKFEPAKWAQLVRKAGAKYAAPVCEHADNFSLWDSCINPVNAVKTGPHRDIIGELYREFRKEGIRCMATFHHQWLWGWYMSPNPEADVYRPENRVYYGKVLPVNTKVYIPDQRPDEEFCAVWRDKVLEVILKYNPDAVYFDSRANLIPDMYKQQVLDALYRRPDTLVTYKQYDFPEGVAVVDIECGRFSDCKDFVWQTDDKLEALTTWCYVKNPKYKSAERIIHQLCDIVSKNGNLLLNVGPKPDGTFDPEAEKTLEEIGSWLSVCGEAIYGTRPYRTAMEGPTVMKDNNYDVKKMEAQIEMGYMMEDTVPDFTSEDIRFTCKNDILFAILLGWPGDGKAAIRALGLGSGAKKIRSVRMLGIDAPLEFVQTGKELLITCPGTKPCKYAYVFRIE
mgnify:CR=1 FL=1